MEASAPPVKRGRGHPPKVKPATGAASSSSSSGRASKRAASEVAKRKLDSKAANEKPRCGRPSQQAKADGRAKPTTAKRRGRPPKAAKQAAAAAESVEESDYEVEIRPVKKARKKRIDEDDTVRPDSEMVNLIRVCRWLVDGDCIANLKAMSKALRGTTGGSKTVLRNRVEDLLRGTNFDQSEFEPSIKDAKLNLDKFNEKFQGKPFYGISGIVEVLEGLEEHEAV